MIRTILYASAMLVASPAVAQTNSAPPIKTSEPFAFAAPKAGVLRAGTSVPLRILQEVTTEGKLLKVGHRFNLEVAEPIMVDGVTVIPVGSPAVAEVTHVRNKGMWGKSGRIEARVVSLRANGRTIRLTGAIDDKGVTGTAGVVGAAILVPVVGFFVTGTSARLPAGGGVTAFTEEDVSFALENAPAPMMVAPVAEEAAAAKVPEGQ